METLVSLGQSETIIEGKREYSTLFDWMAAGFEAW
jgi:hypothetical protein